MGYNYIENLDSLPRPTEGEHPAYPYVVTKTINGLSFYMIIPSRRIEGEVTGQYYETDFISNMIQHINPGDVIWDVGAATGTHTLPVVLKTGENGIVYPFEPDQESADVLEGNAILNNLSNVAVMRIPLWHQDMMVDLHTGGVTGRAPRVSEEGGSVNITFARHLPVQARSISSLIEHDKLRPPDILKIDVEGAELNVLQGMGDRVMPRYIFLEDHTTLNPTRNAVKLLQDRGYTIGYEEARKTEVLYRLDRGDQRKMP